MTQIKYQRFVDRRDVKKLLRESEKKGEFRNRYHTLPPTRVLIFLVVVMALVVGLAMHLSVSLLSLPPDLPTPTIHVVTVLFIMALLTAGSATFTFMLVRKLTSIVLLTEYQILIFARSISSCSAFVLISTQKKNVVYSDKNYNTIFKYDGEQLSALLKTPGIAYETAQSVIKAIEGGYFYKADIQIDHERGGKKSYEISVRPVEHLDNYMLLRGVEKGA